MRRKRKPQPVHVYLGLLVFVVCWIASGTAHAWQPEIGEKPNTMEQLEQEVDEQRLSEAVQENVKERLDALLEAGLLQEKDNAYTASFSYAAGEMQANGKPLERDGLSTLMVSLP